MRSKIERSKYFLKKILDITVQIFNLNFHVHLMKIGEPSDHSSPTGIGFLYEARLRIVSIRSKTHLYEVGHSE